jgi:hypothetical protein
MRITWSTMMHLGWRVFFSENRSSQQSGSILNDTKSNPHSLSHGAKLIKMHSSISKLNADYNRCAIYNIAIDVAQLPLPEVRSLSSTKLHVSSDNHSIGAKTGITVGEFDGVSLLLDDQGNAYKDCVAVKHASISSRFCKTGDSGSIYFALILSDEMDPSNSNDDEVEWLPIAIHRTSNRTHSYGTGSRSTDELWENHEEFSNTNYPPSSMYRSTSLMYLCE